MKWSLSSEARDELAALPETGMGFQWVRATGAHRDRRFLVFNCEVAYDLTDLDLDIGDDPATALANGQRVVRALREAGASIVAAPQPSAFVLLENRIALSVGASGSGPSARPISRPSSLIKSTTLIASRVFHRYSAYHPDRRIDPVSGDFLPGTYAVPESEVNFIPTGFAAVGRLALPVNLPASHHYVIEAQSGTSVRFGTVAPAFGQAGGGVEAFFGAGATNVQVPKVMPSTIPEE
jgi:hypothetical protein